MRLWYLALLGACASTPAPVTQAPAQERDVLAEVVATLRAGECEAAVRDDVDARFRHWAPDAELHVRRELDGELVTRIWGVEEARAVLDVVPDNVASLGELTPECSVVEDLEPGLRRLRATDVEGLAERIVAAPGDAQSIMASLLHPSVWLQVVGHEIVDEAKVVVRYRVFERPSSEVHDAEATYVERDGRWLLVRLSRARRETVAPVRHAETFDDAYYAALDAAVEQAHASGDLVCEIEALLAADRAPEAFERLTRLPDPAQQAGLALRVASRAGRAEELSLPVETLASPEALMAVLRPPPRVCGATYEPLLGRPTYSAKVAAFRVCSPEDEARLADARGGRAALEASDFCAPSPARLRAFFDALVPSVVACRSDRTSGTEPLTFTVTDAGEVSSVAGEEPSRMKRCLEAAFATSPFPAFRIRPPQGSDDRSVVGNGFLGYFPALLQRLQELRLERDNPELEGLISLDMPPPGWEVSWEVTFGPTPSYRFARP